MVSMTVKSKSLRIGLVSSKDTLIGLYLQMVTKVWCLLLEESSLLRRLKAIDLPMWYDKGQERLPKLSKRAEGVCPCNRRIR